MSRAVIAFSTWNRGRKIGLITALIADRGIETVLVVGGIGSGAQANEMIIERAVAGTAQIVAMVDVQVRGRPPWNCVVGDGCAIPCRDGAVDLVLANAVIEHVGDEADQYRFVAEHGRCGRSWAISTPNRWFPIESHTAAVLRHWSPRWRAQRTEFSRLLSLREFKALLPPDSRVIGHWWSPAFLAFSPPPLVPVRTEAAPRAARTTAIG